MPEDLPQRCRDCRAALDRLASSALATGQLDERSSALAHLDVCPSCATVFTDAALLITGEHVRALQDALTEPTIDLAAVELHGLLALWQLQLSLANRLEDQAAIAVGLSVIGMVRRELGTREGSAAQVALAEDAHQLAIDAAQHAGTALSLAISRTDLAYLALGRGDAAVAETHLRDARPEVEAIFGRPGAVCAARLFARVRVEQRRWREAAELLIGGEQLVDAEAQAADPEPVQLPSRRPDRGRSSDDAVRSFWEAFSRRRPAAARHSGILVANLARELDGGLVTDPSIGDDGTLRVAVAVESNPRELPTDRPVFLDVIFLPEGGPVIRHELTARDRVRLRTQGGLHLERPDFLQSMPGSGLLHRHLPTRWFALRMWW